MIGPYIRLYISSTCGELTDGGGAQAARETAKNATRIRPTSRRRREAKRMASLPFRSCGHQEGRYGQRPTSTSAPVTQESEHARRRATGPPSLRTRPHPPPALCLISPS